MDTDTVGRILRSWLFLWPLVLPAFLALGWGRVALSGKEILKALAWTLVGSVCVGAALIRPLLVSCAELNVENTGAAVRAAGGWAWALLPLYSAAVALVPFAFVERAARRRGAAVRSSRARGLSMLVLVLVFAAAGLVVLAVTFVLAGSTRMGQ
jgi:hypothetical protein